VEGSDAVRGDAGLPADVNDSIGMVASRDGTTFAPSPTGPVLAQVTKHVAGMQSASVVQGSWPMLRLVCPQARKRKDAETARANQAKDLMRRG
jgi:hypothetical protein